MTLNLERSLEVISREQLRRLLEISATLSSILDLHQLLNLVISVATEFTNTEVASILLVDPQTGELKFAAATTHENLTDVVVPIEGSIAGWIVRNGEPIIVNNVQEDERHFSKIDQDVEFTTKSMLGVPLVTRSRVIGALEAINKRDDAPYNDQDLILMQALASQAAIAIENAQLFQQFDMVAEIMHEIKTPLMALTTSSELLQEKSLAADEQQRVLTIINRESNRLVNMTKAYLDLARLESGRASISKKPVEYYPLVRDVVDLETPTAAEFDVSLHVNLPSEAAFINGDNDRLIQVLVNLISNGIKYNEPGGAVTITISLTDSEVVTDVHNNGPAIAAAHLDHLFDRFYRVPDNEGFTEGTGLGLAITQKIVEEHGGRISVTSEPESGTLFTVRLPRLHKR